MDAQKIKKLAEKLKQLKMNVTTQLWLALNH